MKTPRADTARTREKLLAAAGKVFAEKGFRDATIADISQQAGTNIMAVNYHFGSKESLYCETWRHVYAESIKAHPPDGGVPPTASPEERLEGQIVALIRRMADKNNQAFSLLYREFANPTGLLEDVIREQLRPLRQCTRELIRELIGPLPDEQQVLFSEMAIIGECMNPMFVRGKPGKQTKIENGSPFADDVEAYARHIVTFSLAGLAAVRRNAEAHPRKVKKTKRPGNGTEEGADR